MQSTLYIETWIKFDMRSTLYCDVSSVCFDMWSLIYCDMCIINLICYAKYTLYCNLCHESFMRSILYIAINVSWIYFDLRSTLYIAICDINLLWYMVLRSACHESTICILPVMYLLSYAIDNLYWDDPTLMCNLHFILQTTCIFFDMRFTLYIAIYISWIKFDIDRNIKCRSHMKADSWHINHNIKVDRICHESLMICDLQFILRSMCHETTLIWDLHFILRSACRV